MFKVSLPKRRDGAESPAMPNNPVEKIELPEAIGSVIPPDILGVGMRWLERALGANLPNKPPLQS